MLPADISAYGYLVDRVINISIGGIIIVGVISFAILIYMLIAFSKSKNPHPLSEVPPLLKKVVLIDYVMIIFDILLLVISSYAWFFFFIRPTDKIKKEIVQKGEDYIEVRVIGRQYFWTFHYPGKDGRFGTADDFKLGNLMIVPQDTNVFVEIESKDVLHSFFIPSARMKYDAIPGRKTHLWFKLVEAGEYEIVCAELCGAMHYNMKAVLRVVPKNEFKNWLEQPYNFAERKNLIQEVKMR
ncbi:MAG: cytochrome c oxidase subunit II [Candidatus Calescibacterium sp.]|nr:cytochrome c oxidase subunit II [Candidatus Calescibacterium sp.]MCX7733840.1 cytochrome c oxidase subunit II [bacterium]MDW8086621.1 cytochrome c oxidase subunit II [Candidatus Calescibacterium sp.]